MESKKVVLSEIDKKDVLKFYLAGGDYCINLNDKDQTSLRNLFYVLISEAVKKEFTLHLEIDPNYKKQLYIEITEEYIKQLNKELKSIVNSRNEDVKNEN